MAGPAEAAHVSHAVLTEPGKPPGLLGPEAGDGGSAAPEGRGAPQGAAEVGAGGGGGADESTAARASAGPGESAGSTGDGGQHARPSRRHPRRWLAALTIVLALVVAAGMFGYVRVRSDVDPSGRPGDFVTVTIPRGASTMRIGQLLSSAGVLRGPDVFAVYIKLKGDGPLLAGTYRLRANEKYSAVVAAREKGPVLVTSKLVVPEGFTVRQIAAAVAALHDGISRAEFMSAATGGAVRSPYEPVGTDNLEGLLFPATYPVPQGETARQLVSWMVATFDAHAARLGLAAAAKRLHYTPYQVVEVASIVEREAKLTADRGPVASVIYNRLARGMPIGAESTLLYGLGDPTGNPDILTPNPYNTLLNKGLPPTPISNPGAASLTAAIAPPSTSYLYWVEVNRDGEMGFASTSAQFKQLQADCRAVHLC